MATVRALLIVVFATTIGPSALASAQTDGTLSEMFRAWCAPCHAEDASGRVPNPTVKTKPIDFTDCKASTPEPDADWELVIARGGPAAGLSSEMPAFGDALGSQTVKDLVQYLRTFCGEEGWPHGNLNFPRPIFTAKAFPENEVVIAPSLSHRGLRYPRFRLHGKFEKRFGKRGHIEIGLPVETIGWPYGRAIGVGDVAVASKYVLHADPQANRIVTGGLELSLATGDTTWGFGRGSAVFEPYLAAGVFWRGLYVQSECRLELILNPLERGEGRRELVSNVYVGRDLARGGDASTVGVELNGLVSRLHRLTAITPQVKKGLTRSGALAAGAGVRVPLNDPRRQPAQWIGYLLWEYLEPVRGRP